MAAIAHTAFSIICVSLVATPTTEGFQARINNFHKHAANKRHTFLSPASVAAARENNGRLWMSDITTSTDDTTEKELEALLEAGRIDQVIDCVALRKQQEAIDAPPLSPSFGAKLINAAASIPLPTDDNNVEETSPTTTAPQQQQQMVSPIQEQRLLKCYNLLFKGSSSETNNDNNGGRKRSLFGSVPMDDLPLPYTFGCTIGMLEETTGKPLSAFRPNEASQRLFYYGGAALCLLEVLLSRVLQIPSQPLFAATLAAAFTDQVLSGGALSEKISWTIQPRLADRVIRHEAGHLLVAHLLGCPVQSVSLGAWDALWKKSSSSSSDDGNGGDVFRGAATAFFDPELNDASRKGIVTRSVIDRYCVVLMAGIAAEALCYGDSEGGSDDERSLSVFLSQTIQARGDLANIPEQARWAATNALVLLREHRDAYERLVRVLQTEGSNDTGRIIMAMEGRS